MTDMRQRVVAVLHDHQVRAGDRYLDHYCSSLHCGWTGSAADHRLHVAEVLMTTLGLTEEAETIPEIVGRVEHTQPCAVPDHMGASEDMHTCGYRRGHFEFLQKTHWVTPWERAS